MKMNMLRFIGASTVDLPLLGAEESGPFVLKGAEGLGPPEVNVRLARTVLEKAVFQGKTANLRQIIALVGLQPDWNSGQTSEELRSTLYSLLTPRYGQMVRAEIVHDGVVQGYAQGHLSKCEPALFTKDPAVQIVLDCDYGYFLNPNLKVQTPVLGTINNNATFLVENDGTAPSGFLMGVTLTNGGGPSLTLSDEDPRGQKLQIDGINWAAGDRFVVDTRPGSRGVWRGTGTGALTSVLNNLNSSVSEWMHLYGGDNRLILNVGTFTWLADYNFTHQPAYWGV